MTKAVDIGRAKCTEDVQASPSYPRPSSWYPRLGSDTHAVKFLSHEKLQKRSEWRRAGDTHAAGVAFTAKRKR